MSTPKTDPAVDPVEVPEPAPAEGSSGPRRRAVVPAVVFGLVGVVAATSFVLGDGSARLLSPLPDTWTTLRLVASFLLGLALAVPAGAAVRPGAVRRNVVIAVLAGTMYFASVATRGVYAAVTFSGDLERGTTRLQVTGADRDALQAVVPGQKGPVLSIPAVEALTASPPRGSCVTVPIDRAAGGAERLATDVEPVTEEAVGPCE